MKRKYQTVPQNKVERFRQNQERCSTGRREGCVLLCISMTVVKPRSLSRQCYCPGYDYNYSGGSCINGGWAPLATEWGVKEFGGLGDRQICVRSDATATHQMRY